jgi:hypothetical protein
MMRVLDFPRSFVTWRIDLDEIVPGTLSHEPPYPMNNSRIPLESRCRIVDQETGTTHTFVLGASCKTERVGAQRDLFLEPNADFMPIISDDSFMHLKTFARIGTTRQRFPPDASDQPDRLLVPIKGTYVSMVLDLLEREGEQLADARAICEATLANHTMVGVTTIRHGRYEASIEYPIKTMNANEREWVYQTDTGPVLWPDLDAPPDELHWRLDVAFEAHNAPDWAQFIVRRPTRIADGVEVYHYSESVRVDGVENTIYRVDHHGPGSAKRVDLTA